MVLYIQACPRTHWFSIRGLPRPEKNVKLKELNGSSGSKRAPSENGPNMVKSSSPNAPSTWLIFFGPVLTLPRRTYLHSASSVLAVRISCRVITVFAEGLWKYYPWIRSTPLYVYLHIFFLKQAAITVLSKLRILGSLPPFSHVYMARCSVDCRQLLRLLYPLVSRPWRADQTPPEAMGQDVSNQHHLLK
jgi:hypothetical protein